MVPLQIMKKKGKPGGRGGGRTLTKTERVPSFFDFFSPPAIPQGEDMTLDEQEAVELQVGVFPSSGVFSSLLMVTAVLEQQGWETKFCFQEGEACVASVTLFT